MLSNFYRDSKRKKKRKKERRELEKFKALGFDRREREREREWDIAFQIWREESRPWVGPNRGALVPTMGVTTTPLTSSTGPVAFNLYSLKLRYYINI